MTDATPVLMTSEPSILPAPICPRKPESELTEEYMNIAASIQKVTEEIIIKLAKKLSKNINSKNLVMAGGVALNCSANGKLLLKKYFVDLE